MLPAQGMAWPLMLAGVAGMAFIATASLLAVLLPQPLEATTDT